MNSWLKWSWHVKKMTLWEFTYKRRKSTSEFSWFTKLISPVCHSEALFWPHDRFFWLRDLPKLTACKGSLSQHFSLVNVGLGKGRWAVSQKRVMIHPGSFRLRWSPDWVVGLLAPPFSLLSYSQHKSFFWDYRSLKPLKSCLDPYSSCLAETLSDKLTAAGFAFSFQFTFAKQSFFLTLRLVIVATKLS